MRAILIFLAVVGSASACLSAPVEKSCSWGKQITYTNSIIALPDFRIRFREVVEWDGEGYAHDDYVFEILEKDDDSIISTVTFVSGGVSGPEAFQVHGKVYALEMLHTTANIEDPSKISYNASVNMEKDQIRIWSAQSAEKFNPILYEWIEGSFRPPAPPPGIWVCEYQCDEDFQEGSRFARESLASGKLVVIFSGDFEDEEWLERLQEAGIEPEIVLHPSAVSQRYISGINKVMVDEIRRSGLFRLIRDAVRQDGDVCLKYHKDANNPVQETSAKAADPDL